jgi:ComEC/Rec2-related protein
MRFNYLVFILLFLCGFIARADIVEGYIYSLPLYSHFHSDFDFYVINSETAPIKNLIRLRWYGMTPVLHVGDAWRVCVTFKSDQRAYLDYHCWPKKLAADDLSSLTSLPKTIRIKMWVDRWRQAQANHIYQVLSREQKDFAGILVALSTGSRHVLPSSFNQVFQNTGTSHLMAISGLHVGLVYGMVYFMIWWLCRRIYAHHEGLGRVYLSIIISVIAAFSYGVVSGLGPSTWRALIMMFLFVFTRFQGWASQLWDILFISFFLELLCFPGDCYSVSFWLSYSAVLVLAYLTQYRLILAKGVWANIKLQSMMALGLLPTSLMFFGQYPWVSLFANLIAIPWVSLFIVPLCLVGLVLTAFHASGLDMVWRLAAYLLKPLMAYLTFLSHMPYNPWHYTITPMESVCLVVAIAAVLAPRGWPGRRLLFCGFLSIRVFDSLGWMHYHSPG